MRRRARKFDRLHAVVSSGLDEMSDGICLMVLDEMSEMSDGTR